MAEQSEDRHIRWEDRFWTSSDGLRLHYRDYAGPSDRPPILCLHGLTRNARDFEDLADRLAGTWRVIVPDFRGRGLSDWDPQPERYNPATYAADVIDVLDRLRIEKAVFIGTSLGGLVTMAVAAETPGHIAAAVLNDIGPRLEEQGLERIRGYVGRQQLFSSLEAAADWLASRDHPIHPAYRDEDWLRMARRLCCAGEDGIRFDYDMAVADNVLRSATAPTADAWPLFRALEQVPLLILRGELSDLLSQGTAEEMGEVHPDAELAIIPKVGHAPDLSEAAAQRALERLLARCL
jgi:pimeloyl-ACP methyl ester carboxylesterase